MGRLPVLLLAVAAASSLGGCVERLISVKTEPPGATVYLDDQVVGKTPCDVTYAWYGTRRLVVEKWHYQSVNQMIDLNVPWWQIFPLDFLTDIVIPIKICDRVEVSYVLEKAPVNREEFDDVRKRAAELREKASGSD